MPQPSSASSPLPPPPPPRSSTAAMVTPSSADGRALLVCAYLREELRLHDLFDVVNSNGHSPLHKAAQRGHVRVCEWLVQALGAKDDASVVSLSVPEATEGGGGAETEAVAARAVAAMASASASGVERLRRCMAADGEGFTPSALARIEGHDGLARFLQSTELQIHKGGGWVRQ
jgi:ankyrin repeat protein